MDRGRWQLVAYENGKRRVMANFTLQGDAELALADKPANYHVEWDAVVSYGDGKKASYGPTYASQVNDDIWGVA